jgi:hypothetical protein
MAAAVADGLGELCLVLQLRSAHVHHNLVCEKETFQASAKVRASSSNPM